MLNREDKKFLRGVFLKRAKKKIKAPISMKTDEKAQLVEMGGAIAACLVLGCAAIAHFSPTNQDEDKQGVADATPMVYVNDIHFTFNPAAKKAIQNRKMTLFISERF
ncbi:hypothetical protein D7X94_04765 [Acutalibacter sp. 1XD8-33]|uniref:hypothetical protein n=1 Tax=Acutalibacter sp. 1XD8-33 TaxID=2320081 RepID=UPI000EA0F5C4|nr:hypothetical protein [Acutalibacter sp. 1XD8-33]RKJ41123.1 hypothetical protein D7X94_04765 [Acutalibacter sp. 1XD8-33]